MSNKKIDFVRADVQTALNLVTQQLDYIANSNTPPKVSAKETDRLSWSVQLICKCTVFKVWRSTIKKDDNIGVNSHGRKSTGSPRWQSNNNIKNQRFFQHSKNDNPGV